VSRALDARLGQAVERLARAGRLGFPIGPLEGWPEAELHRFQRMIELGGSIERAAWTRLTIADLQWLIDSAPDDTEGAAATGGASRGEWQGAQLWP
jgi:hypothetical protein